MGIQGLLPLLKSIMVPTHIKELQGCSVAVDTYSWLHKGALSCSRDLCKGLPTTRHIEYCMHRVNLLRHNGVKPILVFDGGLLPMKGEQENKRGSGCGMVLHSRPYALLYKVYEWNTGVVALEKLWNS
ncbi:exonuclease 1 [Quercus suber]|uniref:Exonuclease 1 n=1 Tax=Quercus suber TaxID=58331 RepID=A0AAW0L4A1_QUESU